MAPFKQFCTTGYPHLSIARASGALCLRRKPRRRRRRIQIFPRQYSLLFLFTNQMRRVLNSSFRIRYTAFTSTVYYFYFYNFQIRLSSSYHRLSFTFYFLHFLLSSIFLIPVCFFFFLLGNEWYGMILLRPCPIQTFSTSTFLSLLLVFKKKTMSLLFAKI